MRGWIKATRKIAIFAGGLLGCLPAVFAAAGTTTTAVTPLTSPVTYSRVSPPLETYIGYTITVVNDTGNTLNHVRFEASPSSTTSVTVTGLACDPAGGAVLAGAVISCPIGQLSAGAGVSFTIVFVAPLQSSGVSSFLLSGRTVYGEGTNPVADKIEIWTTATVGLVDEIATKVMTIIPTGGGEFSTFGDQFTTKIDVPASQKVTVATISEQPTIGNCNNFRTCFGSDIRIVDTAGNTALFTPYLTIVLHMDAANIKKGTRIESVTLQYTNSLNVTSNVGNCASPTTPQAGGVPCIAKSTHFKNKKTPGWTPALDGDFVWEVINTNNGRFTLL